MEPSIASFENSWPQWRKIVFRFFFVYMFAQINPLMWFTGVQYLEEITKFYNEHFRYRLVTVISENILHLPVELGWVPSFAFFALIVCVAWSLFDRKSSHYTRTDYWLRNMVRYYMFFTFINYGVLKLWTIQMPRPTLSQLITPLGDLSPMRLTWLHLGSSPPYQIFTGAIEVLAALFLLHRKTVTLGLVLMAGILVNIVALNFSYDIGVQLYSSLLLTYVLFLLAYDWRRLTNFSVNKLVEKTTLYDLTITTKWMKWVRVAAKASFVGITIIRFVYTTHERFTDLQSATSPKPIKAGIYDVAVYTKENETISEQEASYVRWSNMVFEKGQGSVDSSDTLFWQRYGRGYFTYKTDTINKLVKFYRPSLQDTIQSFDLHYQILDSTTFQLWGKIRNESVAIELKKTARTFQLMR
jgi:hypothetical protein